MKIYKQIDVVLLYDIDKLCWKIAIAPIKNKHHVEVEEFYSERMPGLQMGDFTLKKIALDYLEKMKSDSPKEDSHGA